MGVEKCPPFLKEHSRKGDINAALQRTELGSGSGAALAWPEVGGVGCFTRVKTVTSV